jgi:hypothetical protein
MMTIRARDGGEPRRVAICLTHAESLGSAWSLYEVISEPKRGQHPKGYVRPGQQRQGKNEKGDINRSLRVLERYSKTQRGRLGE